MIRIAASLEAFDLPFRSALQQASKAGLAGVQFDAVGQLAPHRLGDSARREIRHLARGHGLEIAGLRCPLRRGLDDAIDLQPRIERIRQAMTLGAELGAGPVIVDAGPLPKSADDTRYATLTEALDALARHGDRTGTVLALESGRDRGDQLAAFLARFDTGGLAVACNPANSLIHGFDPVAQLTELKGRIAVMLATDARRVGAGRTARSVPVGHGDIDWLQLLGTLSAQEFLGWLTIERQDAGPTDVAAAATFLRRLL